MEFGVLRAIHAAHQEDPDAAFYLQIPDFAHIQGTARGVNHQDIRNKLSRARAKAFVSRSVLDLPVESRRANISEYSDVVPRARERCSNPQPGGDSAADARSVGSRALEQNVAVGAVEENFHLESSAYRGGFPLLNFRLSIIAALRC